MRRSSKALLQQLQRAVARSPLSASTTRTSFLTQPYTTDPKSPTPPRKRPQTTALPPNDIEILLSAAGHSAIATSTTPVNTGDPIPAALTDLAHREEEQEISASAPSHTPATTANMSTDDDYMAFLNKASNEPAPASSTTAKQQQQHRPAFKTSDVEVPRVLADEGLHERFYVSESDEPFEAVAFAWKEGVVLDLRSFKATMHPPAHMRVEASSVEEFDPRGEYGDVVGKVGEAAGVKRGDVKVFRVEAGRARVVWWVLGLDGAPGRVVGVKVDAVES